MFEETYFEKLQVPESELPATLQKANQEDASRRLILRADRGTHYADVRKLFKVCQAIGFPGIPMRVNSLKQDDK
jgi:biopolymer transport protein TolR